MIQKLTRLRAAAVLTVFLFLGLFLAFKTGLHSRAEQNLSAMLAPTITATNNAALVADADGDGIADPGDTIEYSVTINNGAGVGAGNDATGLIFTDTLDPNMTLVPGSVSVSPIAGNDAYDTVGNTQLQVGASQTVSPAIFVNGNVLTNDIDPDGGTLTVIAQTNAATTGGGSVTVAANGTFIYTPPVNFTGGTDTFNYQATDGTNNGAGTVTINVVGLVRYVKNDAPAGGDGRSNTPFNTLAGGQTATAGVTIYVFQGNGTIANQSTGITLANNQRLIGAGVALVMPGITVNGTANPQILAAGAQPLITNTNAGGNGVSVGTATNVEIRGLNIAGNANAIDINFTGAGISSHLIANNTVSAAGQEGIDINGNGTGTLNLALNNNAVSSTGTGIDVERLNGTVRITSFSNNSISGNTAGTGFRVNTVIFDADPGSAGFQTVNAGNLAIGQSGNGVGGAGMNLAGTSGDLSFTDLDIFADNGSALAIASTGTFNAGASTGFRIIVPANVASLVATGGSAANITSATIDLQLAAMSSTNSASEGVLLNTVAGTFSAPAGSAITNATGADFSITGSGTVNATYNGTITDDVGALVTISGQTGGTKSFTGAITDGNDGDGSGISLTGNTGATISFSGGLLLSTGANAAFTATGGGTVSVCDKNPCGTGANVINTLTTTTGTAVNIAAPTNIGANGATFRSITVNNGASNSATNAIILNGTTGNFTVTGDGSTGSGKCGGGTSPTAGLLDCDGSGGTLSRTTQDAVLLTNASNVTLRQMNITNPGWDGVQSTGGGNIVLSAIDINHPGNANPNSDGSTGNPAGFGGGNGWFSQNITGTNSFDNNSRVFNWQCPTCNGILNYRSSATNFTSFTVDDAFFSTSATGADGILFDTDLVATSGTVRVTDSDFTLIDQDGLQINNDGTGTITAVIKRNNFHDADATSGDGNNTIFLANAGSGTLNFTIGADANADLSANPTLDRNTFKNLSRLQALTGMVAVNAATTDKTGTRLNGTIRNNVITNDAGFDSRRDGISFGIEANGGSHGSHKILVADNTISNVGLMGIRVLLNSTNDVAGGSLPDTNLTIRNNTISNVGISPLVTGDSQTAIEIEPNFSNFSNGGDMGTNLLLQANTITNNSASGVGDTVEVIARGGNTGTNHTMNLTMLGNNLTNTGGTSVVDIYTSTDPALTGTGVTLNLDMNSDNIPANANNTTNSGGAAGSIQLRNNVSGALYRIENLGANPANTFVSQRNNNDTVTVSGTVGSTGAVTLPQLPDSFPSAAADPVEENANQAGLNFDNFKTSVKAESISNEITAEEAAEFVSNENALQAKAESSEPSRWGTFIAFAREVSDKLGEAISPTAVAQGKKEEIAVNVSGETVTVGAPSGFTLPATKSVTIKFRATINNVPALAQVSNQGTVAGSNIGASVLTDDPTVAGAANPTVTLVDRTLVAVASSQNPSIVGQGVMLTATLTGTPAHASGNPTGTVQFFNDGNPIGSPVNVTAGAVNTATAQITVTDFAAGSFTITAQYSGGGQFNSGSGSLTGNPQVVSNTAVWDGSASADWNNAANWTTNFAPGSANDVSIPSGVLPNNPAISVTDVTVGSLNEATVRTLTVGGGRTLTVTGACTINGTLTIAGSFSCGSLTGTGTVAFTGAAAQNIPPLTYQNLTIGNASGVTLAGDTTVGGVLTLTGGNVHTGANSLILGGAATVSRTSGHVVGNVRRTFNAASSFAFPVGTANGFSPATVNVTAGTFPLAFNVRAVQGPQPALNAATSLQRYWQIAPTGGNPTATLTFNYLDPIDIMGSEASYTILRVNGAQVSSFPNNPPNVVIDTTNNVATITGVTTFSDWTLGAALPPTSANVGIAGRVVNSQGRGVFRAQVALMDSNGQMRTVRTNPFGYYRFTDVPSGAIYTVIVSHKQHEFDPQILNVSDEVTELIIFAREK